MYQQHKGNKMYKGNKLMGYEDPRIEVIKRFLLDNNINEKYYSIILFDKPNFINHKLLTVIKEQEIKNKEKIVKWFEEHDYVLSIIKYKE